MMGNSLDNLADLFCDDNDSLYLLKNNRLLNLTSFFDYPIESHIWGNGYYDQTLYLTSNNYIYTCKNPLDIFENEPVHVRLIDVNFPNIGATYLNNDSLYIASDAGLTIIPWSFVGSVTTQAPVPYFKSVQVNEKEAEWPQDKIQVTGNNKIRFDFGSINYSSTPVIYSYRLEGADTSWTNVTNSIVVFQNLAPGDYTLKFRVRKPISPWSKPIECRITIHATLWQHTLFYVGLFLLFGGLLFLFIIRRKNLQLKRRELEHQLVLLEQKALQAMMNPHFIFNSLGSIQNFLLQKKSGEAGLYLSQFARLIRQNLNAINSASINLEEETDRLKNYLDLERLRMENKFEYRIEVDEYMDADEIMIPSMIIQPFVENAILHGIAPMESKGVIKISFMMQEEKSMKVNVEDNGIGMKQSGGYSTNGESHPHLGVEMTRRRLVLLGEKYHVNTGVEYCEVFPGTQNPGTRVELVVPVSNSKE